MSAFTDALQPPQEPVMPDDVARWAILPFVPTTWLSRSSSEAIRSFISTISLNALPILPAMPCQFTGSRTEKSPFLRAFKAARRARWSISSAGDAGSTAMSKAPREGIVRSADLEHASHMPSPGCQDHPEGSVENHSLQ